MLHGARHFGTRRRPDTTTASAAHAYRVRAGSDRLDADQVPCPFEASPPDLQIGFRLSAGSYRAPVLPDVIAEGDIVVLHPVPALHALGRRV